MNDEDDEDSEDDDEDDDYYDSGDEHGNQIWEAPAKNYSNMNLKEAISKERESKVNEGDSEAEAKRKLKNAKKRAEKRRKQKEKKQREAAMKEEEEGAKKQQAEADEAKHLEEIRRLREAKITQRVELFSVLKSGDLTKVKTFIGDALDTTLGPNKQDAGPDAEQRRTVMRDLISNHAVLHCCVADAPTADGAPEPRLAVAKFLLGLKSFPVGLSTMDDDGRTALHVACKKSDSTFVKLLLGCDRRAQLDVNLKCNKSGWTALHYAASQGDVVSVRALMEAGCTLNVHASTGKGSTALELVKTRLQNSGHFTQAHIANLQQIAREISEAIRNLEKVKQAKEAEAREREEKLAEERRKQAEKEEKERELLERKQKQIKEKQDKRGPTTSGPAAPGSSASSSAAAPAAAPASASAPVAPAAAASSASANGHAAAPAAKVDKAAAAAATSVDKAAEEAKGSKRKRNKKGKKDGDEEAAVSGGSLGLSEAAVIDVASRDELVDHLLAMGFSEPDCLAAIALYGKDLDKALSWLCERPTKEAATTASTTAALLSQVRLPP